MKNFVYKLKIWFIPGEENNYSPRFLASGTLFNVVLGLLILKIIAIGFLLYIPNTLFFADLTKSSLITMTNQARQIYGLGELEENEKLNEAAAQKAQDMLNNDYFAHQSPQGISPWYWFKQLGYNYKVAGENLAIGFLDSQEVLNAWENSPTHRQNLLSPKFKEMGIAVATGDYQGSKTTVVVQLFGTPASNTIYNATQNSSIAKTVVQTKQPEQKAEASLTEIKSNPENNSVPVSKPESEDIMAIKGETSSNQEDLQTASQPTETKNTPSANGFLQFMMFTYPNILQKVILAVLAIITIALILNIFIKIKHQDKKLIAKTAIFIILLILFVLSDRGLIVQIIPHNLLI